VGPDPYISSLYVHSMPLSYSELCILCREHCQPGTGSRPCRFMWDLWFAKLHKGDCCMRSNQLVHHSGIQKANTDRLSWNFVQKSYGENLILDEGKSRLPAYDRELGMLSLYKITRIIQFLNWKCMLGEVVLKVHAHQQTHNSSYIRCVYMYIRRRGMFISVLGITIWGLFPRIGFCIC
jgi:hypothetical protein